MKESWRFVVMGVFLGGFFLVGLLGTSTSMTFIWPAYALLGLAGALSIGLLFKKVGFSLPRWSTLAVVSLTAYLLIRAANSPVAYFAREDAALIITAFLCYCLFLSLVSTGNWRNRLLYALAALVAVNLVFAFVQAVFAPTLSLIPGYERTFTNRVGGLFNHPDHFAGFIGALVPVLLAMSLYGRQRVGLRRFFAGLAVLSLLAALYPGNATGYLALFFGLGTFALLTGVILYRKLTPGARKRSLLLVTGLALAALTGAGLTMAGSHGATLKRALLTNDEGSRLVLIWKAGIQQALEAPVLGTGSRSSPIYGRLFRDKALGSSPTEPGFIHNEYLQMLADYGLAGLALLFITLALHGSSGLSFVRAYASFGCAKGRLLPQSDHLAFALGAMSSLSAIGALSFFDFTMHLPVFSVVTAVFLAVLAAPDPMAAALKPGGEPLIPGGVPMFINRSVVFGCGIAMLAFGLVFSRSEFHCRMAHLSFEADPGGYRHFRHLKAAREIDSKNPFLFALSARAQVAGITPSMTDPERRQVLEQADYYFSRARDLYPQDVFAAIGHASVLDQLGKREHARDRLREALKMAPGYGNLLLAEAGHHLRHGNVIDAEKGFIAAMKAHAFRDTAAAGEGLRTLEEWKRIAEGRGINWRKDSLEAGERPTEATLYHAMPTGRVSERSLAGEAVPPGSSEN